MNPEPFQRLTEKLRMGFLNKEEFSKAWDGERKGQEESERNAKVYKEINKKV